MKRFKTYLKEKENFPGMIENIKKLADSVVEKSTSRMTTLTLKSSDRIGLKVKITNILKKNRIKIKETTTSGSVSATNFIIAGVNYRLIYKPKSGGGSGAGAVVTKLAESAVCIYVAALIHNNKPTLEYLISNKSKITTNIDIDGKYDDIIKWLGNNPDWDETSIKSARLIHGIKKISATHVAHRGSSFFNSIYKEFSRLLKPLNKIGLRIGTDKWNPGDIWISSIKTIEKRDNLTDYNGYIADLNISGKLFAVSLKKSGSPTVKLINNSPLDIEYIGIRPVKKPLSSKDMFIEFKENDVKSKGAQFRSFNIGQNVQGEIKGVYANHGKIGFGNIKFILGKMSTYAIRDVKELQKLSDEKLIDEIENLYKKLGMTFNKIDPAGKSKEFLITKIQALDIAISVDKAKNPSEVVAGMINYASSKGLAGMFDNSWYYKIS